MIGFGIVLLALLAAWGWKWYRNLTQSIEAANARMEELQSKIFALPFDEIKRRAESLLQDPQKFICAPRQSTKNQDFLSLLAPILADLFTRYESIEGADLTSQRIGWDEIEVYPVHTQFLKIGMTAADEAVCVKPREETVYVLDSIEHTDEEYWDTYPTIYHWIVFESGVILSD